MPRLARPLLRLLAILLLLQWAGGMLPHLLPGISHGVSPDGVKGETVMICSPDGMRTIQLGEDGQPAGRDAAPPLCCLLCPGPMPGAEPTPLPTIQGPREATAPAIATLALVRLFSFLDPPRVRHSRAPPLA
ncbi:DUF2946 family protein [Roseomonas gilardii subsp. gilardii]|uniref:DUF2946 family protein n=1 Tax=Roseomonas gilardii TaxID=257708 RepID=UPI001FFBBD18|nr:DUF2946 family protein [Roseomonas gilardii]UPG71139.1 DUF2946 family protein [Roseomonas gilardii subsp. gilardii]